MNTLGLPELRPRARNAALSFILLFLLLPLPVLRGEAPGEALAVAAVQFELSPALIHSPEAFRAGLREAADKALEPGPADLLIFPEYLGVFAALIPWQEEILGGAPFEEVWEMIRRESPELKDLNALFLSRAAATDRFLDETWGALAREKGVFILGGTRFSYDPRLGGAVNRAVVYGPGGEPVYGQNKFFLTPFEEEILGLVPGDLSDTEGFRIKGKLIRLTICRDSFLPRWNELYRRGDLWIDIKANGTAYTPDQKALFRRALPARLADSPIPYGITVCLTGSFLNLLWEGESSMIKKDKDGSVVYTRVSRRSDGMEILRGTIP